MVVDVRTPAVWSNKYRGSVSGGVVMNVSWVPSRRERARHSNARVADRQGDMHAGNHVEIHRVPSLLWGVAARHVGWLMMVGAGAAAFAVGCFSVAGEDLSGKGKGGSSDGRGHSHIRVPQPCMSPVQPLLRGTYVAKASPMARQQHLVRPGRIIG